MEFRNLLIVLFLLFTVSLSNPVSSAPKTSLAASPQSSSRQRVNIGQTCIVQKDVCCSGYCRHEAMNSVMGICTPFYSPVDLSSRDEAASEVCLPDNHKNCKNNKDCCSGHRWGSRLGGSFCFAPAVATEVNAREDAVEDITQMTCAADGQSCSGNDGDCCSDFCWCTIWNPFACMCAARDEASIDISVTRGHSIDGHKPMLFAPNAGDAHGISEPSTCIEGSFGCVHDLDCCSNRCDSGHCHTNAVEKVNKNDGSPIPTASDNALVSESSLDIRDVSVGLSCGINNSKCADNQDCCSRLCKTGRCKKDETKATVSNLDDRDISDTRYEADKYGDQEASYHVDLVPPPPCKLGGVTCRINRECCYGKCDGYSKSCWQPRDTLP